MKSFPRLLELHLAPDNSARQQRSDIPGCQWTCLARSAIMDGCTVAVIGGGPAGTLAAAHFAKLGATVTVYERYSITKQNSVALGWVIALGKVACDAIEAAGLSADFGLSAR